MAKKAKSKPMKEIVRRFEPSIFEFVYFEDDIMLNAPVENWPIVDYLIAFSSGGYPLDKVIQYVELRKPITINDVAMQRELYDRRRVYQILAKHNISTPRHIILEEKERAENVVVENDDWIEIKGIRFTKPVVEKPIDAEDHNIYIYYPMSAGGGSKRLFRKVGDKSSQFYPEVNELRKEGSYIYEEFIETQGVDVKVTICVCLSLCVCVCVCM
jgi:inositol-hexakisphosphate/diphosphoinositol-pentakisphosphate 1-kinase